MMNETLKVLQERRSIRKYKAEQIKDEELDAILEAGTWAASGKGLQSAVMVVVQDQETISMLSKANAEIQGKSGADWQLSIGAEVEAAELVQEGRRTINGVEHEAPFYHVTKSTLREVSVVAVGADKANHMKVTAYIQHKGLYIIQL